MTDQPVTTLTVEDDGGLAILPELTPPQDLGRSAREISTGGPSRGVDRVTFTWYANDTTVTTPDE